MLANKIENSLLHHLSRATPNHRFSEIYKYTVVPGGKYFRPSLAWCILHDLNEKLFINSIDQPRSAHSLFASALEIHHAYTLVHDDLPSMDNDLERRGKPAAHVAFGEWQAILCGDGLLNLSYQLLSEMPYSKNAALTLKIFSRSLGPKGLIQGQVLDLNCEMTNSLMHTITTHELKTARLIQVAITGSALLARDEKSLQMAFQYNNEKQLWKFSRLLGIHFQFIDDLTELASKSLSEHEKAINPWPMFTNELYNYLLKNLEEFKFLSEKLNLVQTNKFLADYYQQMAKIIEEGKIEINCHLKTSIDLDPIIFFLDRFALR